MKLRLSDLPKNVIDQYNLDNKATAEGYVYIEIQKGIMAYSQQACWHKNLLEMRPTGKGYQQSKYTPGLWKHDTQPTEFTLVVDDFGIKYCGSKNA